MISGYTCSNYISVLVNEKRFLLISVSVFELKVYTLDHIGKKWMPICRICDPPRGFTNWMEFNAHQVCRHGAKISICATMKGTQKNSKVCLGFKTTYFIMKKIKKCERCKQKFMFESQLSRYHSTHTDKKPFKCASKTCPKFKEGFKSQQALTQTHG